MAETRLHLPPAPAAQAALLATGGVACWEGEVEIATYEAAEPDRFPMFFNHRVYQGSDGQCYPMPFTDRIATRPRPRNWRAIHLENEYVRLMLLPELGGRIHVALDKTRDYDVFYRNNVIKPALVGIAGPWISGGVEFNWPQHHRVATFLPVETTIERDVDGAVTVWHSDLDPLQRMRGTHGVRLAPGDAAIEVRARLYNCTDGTQTFLWWANVAAAAHEDYQAFFPTDVRWVADHARRAITTYPAADRPYYGVDYPALAEAQPGADHLDVYSHIKVPTSYMVTDTRESFFGGYDHRTQAGFVHWADADISPGKKLWTWGNGPIGHAWDRQLTDADGPYVELMAGVFTDNQPDFSFLLPGETRSFSQYWFPIQDIGVAHAATRDAALSVNVLDGELRVGVATTSARELRVALRGPGLDADLVGVARPGEPLRLSAPAGDATAKDDVRVTVTDAGRVVVAWNAPPPIEEEPWSATAPPHADELSSVDELLLTAQHLDQYRHPTRDARPYLERVLALDPSDSRAHLALAAAEFQAGDYPAAEGHLRLAEQRITRRNLNPRSGELHHRLGLVLERLGRFDDAARAFAKSAWDGAYALAGHLGAGRTLLRLGRTAHALDHARQAAAQDPRNTLARLLLVVALRRAGLEEEAEEELRRGRVADPLDPFLAALDGDLDVADPRTYLAAAAELRRCGELRAALEIAGRGVAAGATRFGNVAASAHYLRALLLDELGDAKGARCEREAARAVDRTWAFPAGLDELDALRAAIDADPCDAVALGLLGSWLLGSRRTGEALGALLAAIEAGSDDPVVLRNAAVALVNATSATPAPAAPAAAAAAADTPDTSGKSISGRFSPVRFRESFTDPLVSATELYDRAIASAGPLPRLLHERDQLARLRGSPSGERLAQLESSGGDVLSRDDLTISYLHLLLDAGRVDEGLAILATRTFQPFEGGEGEVIAVFDRAQTEHARRLLPADPAAAAELLDAGVDVPHNLGEGRHPAAPIAARLVLAGDAHHAAGAHDRARRRWRSAVDGVGPLDAAPRSARPDDYWIGVARLRLGEPEAAADVWDRLDAAADRLAEAPEEPDYFATSLPRLLLFTVDDHVARESEVAQLRTLAAQGRARTKERA